MTLKILTNVPRGAAKAHLILAHGAGAPMDSDFLDSFVVELTARDIAVSRFEFAYMADRRKPDGKKRPPPRVDKLTLEFSQAIEHIIGNQTEAVTLVIGGKSMGGRVASMIADYHFCRGTVSGLICLGYPFHPANKPEKLRTEHLRDLKCPTLIVQGDRDKLGNYNEVSSYQLSRKISLNWLPDGDHDFKPRMRSGFTHDRNMKAAADAVSTFIEQLNK